MSPNYLNDPSMIDKLKEAVRKETGHILTITLDRDNKWLITHEGKLTPMQAAKLENLVRGFVLGWELK